MKEALSQAREELKRADHLMYVSLKYTRTVDVIKSIVERLITCVDYSLTALLRYAKSQKHLSDVPTLPRLKVDACKMLYPGDQFIQNYLDFFQLLRRIDKARFDRTQEYRRHVTMTAHLDDVSIEITIDIIGDYYNRTKEFVQHVERVIEGANE